MKPAIPPRKKIRISSQTMTEVVIDAQTRKIEKLIFHDQWDWDPQYIEVEVNGTVVAEGDYWYKNNFPTYAPNEIQQARMIYEAIPQVDTDEWEKVPRVVQSYNGTSERPVL